MTPANTQLYSNVDEVEWLKKASASCLRYGGDFVPIMFTKAEGLFIYTATGHKLLDFTSGQMSCLIGHGHPDVVQTVTAHAAKLDHLFSGYLSVPVIQLTDKLASLLPAGLDKTMFLSTGGESNECAIKLAKKYTGKFEIVALADSWHGMTGAAHSMTYHADRTGYGPMMPGNLSLPAPNAYRSIFRHPNGSYDWETELNYGWEMVDKSSVGSIAAVIVEPILSSAGIHPLPEGYLKAMKKHCDKRRCLLIVDEAQTGVGRCGSMFAIDYEGVVPDILTLSKTLGNGLPLSAVITSNEIEKVSYDKGFNFYTTHANDPLPAAVGLKVIEVVMRDDLVEKARLKGLKLQAALLRLMKMYGCIGDVRGRGLLAGVEIVSDRKTKEPAAHIGNALTQRMRELGLSANLSKLNNAGRVIRIAPPITISDEELGLGLSIFEEALRTTPGTMPF